MEDVPAPAARPGQIVVKVAAAAVCGSDFHMDDFGATPPLVLGHEVSGTVAETGKGVKGLKAGDRVVLNPVQYCGTCWCCKHGVQHLCQNYRHLGDANIPGGWAEYVAIDARNAYRIPKNVDFVAAALTEPAAVCYESFERARLQPGNSVLIIGDGPFGFLHAQIARARKAGKIIVAGHYDQRLARIRKETRAVICNTHCQDVLQVVKEEIGPPGADVVIEATGAGLAPEIGLKALRPRGTMVIFSYIWKPAPLTMGLIHMRELNMVGACRSLDAFKPCLDLMRVGKINTGKLVDLEVPLEKYQQAIDTLRQQKERVFKVVFTL
jgi:L-iditol 2-dehydrogenase